jgi:hypothetical protein
MTRVLRNGVSGGICGRRRAGQSAGRLPPNTPRLAPFIDPLTVGIIRIDMTRLDPEAVVQQGLKWIALFASPQEQKRAADQWAKEKPDIDKPGDVPQAGGRKFTSSLHWPTC